MQISFKHDLNSIHICFHQIQNLFKAYLNGISMDFESLDTIDCTTKHLKFMQISFKHDLNSIHICFLGGFAHNIPRLRQCFKQVETRNVQQQQDQNSPSLGLGTYLNPVIMGTASSMHRNFHHSSKSSKFHIELMHLAPKLHIYEVSWFFIPFFWYKVLWAWDQMPRSLKCYGECQEDLNRNFKPLTPFKILLKLIEICYE